MPFIQKFLLLGALLGLSAAQQERKFESMGARDCRLSNAPKLPLDPSRLEKYYTASSQLSAFCDSKAELNLNAGPTDPILKKNFEGLTFDIIRYPPDSKAGAALNISKGVCEAAFGNVLSFCGNNRKDELPNGFVYALKHMMEFRIYPTDYVPKEVVAENNWKPGVPAKPPTPPTPPPKPLPPTPTAVVQQPLPTLYRRYCHQNYKGPLDFLEQNSQERQSVNTTISSYCDTMDGKVQVGKKNTFLRWASSIGWVRIP